MASNHPILSQLDALIETARAEGAKAAEVLLVRREGNRLEVREGKVVGAHHPRQERVQGAVYLADGRSAPFSVDASERGVVAGAVRKAVAAAASAAPQLHGGPADRYDITTRGLGIDDVRYPDIQLEDREEVALINDEACAAEPGVQCLGCVYEDARTTRAFASTRGVEVISYDTLYSVHLQARLGERSLAHIAEARNFANVGSLPFGVDLSRRLTSLAGSDETPKVGLPAGDLPLILESRVVAWIIERLGPVFSQEAVASGKVFISNHLGERLGSNKVHLMDDPGLHGGLRTRAFDDRGVPPMALPVIREGLQAGLFYGVEQARAEDIRPTGHRWEGSLSPGNLILLAGNRSRTQMLSEVPSSICFDHIDGKLDLRTGKLDVSGPAFLLEKGRRVGVIDRVRIKTDVVTLLSGVQEFSSDQERIGAVDCATALVVGVPLAR
jgi:PmbA protein